MAKLIVTDAVRGCDLEKVELDIEPLSLTFTGKNFVQEIFTLRGFFPETVNGEYHFMEDVCYRLLDMFEQTEGEEREFYQWVILMLQFYYIYPELDPCRTRHFNINTLDHSETFQKIAELTQSKGFPKPERLVKFAGETAAPTTRLIQEAVYIRPDMTIPLSRPDYVNFQEQILSEMTWAKGQIEEIKRDAIEKQRRRIESGKKISAGQRAKALATLDAIEAGEKDASMSEICQRMEREVLKRALEIEDEKSARFADLVEEARRLTGAISREVEEKRIEMLEEDGVSFTPEYAACIKEQLDTKAIDCLLWKTILRYEEVFRLEPIRGIELFEIDEGMDESKLPDVEPLAESQESEFQQYIGLWSAYKSDDIFEKWYMVGWISNNLVNRNECLRLLQREAEGVYHGVLNYAFKQIYRKIRHRMSRAERRAYALLYFRQPAFNYRVAVMDPVILSFFTGMDQETQGLILLVLVFKVRQWDEVRDLDKELERRWRAYLRFYPYWLEIIQDEDREAKHQKVVQNKMLSVDFPLGSDKNGRRLTLKDTIPNPDRQANLLQAVVLSSQSTLEEWTTKYCTPKQARHIVRYFGEGKTEAEIAEEEGVSQQAVSKSIRTAIERIHEGLMRDGLLEAD